VLTSKKGASTSRPSKLELLALLLLLSPLECLLEEELLGGLLLIRHELPLLGGEIHGRGGHKAP
jgi:hypothetical protein